MYTHPYTGLLCNTCLITVDLLTIILHTLLLFCIITLCLQVTPPESVTPRCVHSITATSLGPGLTEVLVFGGKQTFLGNPIADTTILRFGEQLLVHVAMATHCLIDKYTQYMCQ